MELNIKTLHLASGLKLLQIVFRVFNDIDFIGAIEKRRKLLNFEIIGARSVMSELISFGRASD